MLFYSTDEPRPFAVMIPAFLGKRIHFTIAQTYKAELEVKEGLPLGASLAGANEAEWRMVQQTLDLFSGKTTPERLIGDKAYDCAYLDETLAEAGQSITHTVTIRSSLNLRELVIEDWLWAEARCCY